MWWSFQERCELERRGRGSLLVAALFVAITPSLVFAQVPTSEFLFQEDSTKLQDSQERERGLIGQTDKVIENEVDFQAPQVEFLQEENVMKGTGGVLLSGDGIQVQAEEGTFAVESKDARLNGGVILTGPDGTVRAEQIELNLDSEVGTFTDAQFTLEEGAYDVSASRVDKLSETEYELDDCWLSTCHCADESHPWKISGSDINITQEGYAHAYGATIDMWDQPVMYLPWVAFPVKQERTSGLLVPEFSYSSRDGFGYSLPLFGVIDDTSDITLTPFGETRTRVGTGFDFRKAFSTRSSMNGRIVYSNESARDGDLRGTDVTNLFDPTFDEDRFGGFFKQSWSTPSTAAIPLSIVSDIHLVSDSLFLREMEDEEIGLSNSRFTTSRVLMNAALGDYFSANVSGEYYQAFLSDQDLTFQRLPELTIQGSKSYRPFGFNPYGLKVTPGIEINATQFARDTGYDGLRFDVSPYVKIPFHYQNYFNSQLQLTYHQTQYDLDETYDPRSLTDLESSNERSLFQLSYKASTALERVYDLPQDTWLKTVTSLGSRNQDRMLERVKHTIEPTVAFDYVPGTDQDDLPLFDSFDRYREKSTVTYGVTSRLYGSFKTQRGARTQFEELAPELSDFWGSSFSDPLDDIDGGGDPATNGVLKDPFVVGAGQNEIRQLAFVSLYQAYDYVEDQESLDPTRQAFSDVALRFGVSPTPDFSFTFQSNYDFHDEEFSSWSVGSYLRDDRGDRLTARYTFIDDRVSQLEGNLEIRLSKRFGLGYYARYDDEEGEFIEQQAALRLRSKCDCWHLDFGVSDEINPDKKRFLVSFTLKGIGDVSEKMGLGEERQSS